MTEEEEKIIHKLIEDINNIVKIFSEKSKTVSKVFIYVLPKELETYNSFLNQIQKRISMEIKLFYSIFRFIH